MKEHSHLQLGWYTLGVIQKEGSKRIVKDLLVRWNEQIEERDMPEVRPSIEAVEYYLEAAQAAVLQLAQDLEAQEAGFA